MVGTNGVGWLGLCIAWGTAGMAVALAEADEGPFRDLSLDRARSCAARLSLAGTNHAFDDRVFWLSLL